MEDMVADAKAHQIQEATTMRSKMDEATTIRSKMEELGPDASMYDMAMRNPKEFLEAGNEGFFVWGVTNVPLGRYARNCDFKNFVLDERGKEVKCSKHTPTIDEPCENYKSPDGKWLCVMYEGACRAAHKKSTIPYHAGINEGKTWVKCCAPGKRSDPCDPEQCIGPDDVDTKKLATGRPKEDCTAERRRWVELGGRRTDESCPSTGLLASESDFDGCRVPTIEETAFEPIDRAKRFDERFVRTPRHGTFEAYKEEAQREARRPWNFMNHNDQQRAVQKYADDLSKRKEARQERKRRERKSAEAQSLNAGDSA
jgi:hypothetical protein